MREILDCNHGKWWRKGDKNPCKKCKSDRVVNPIATAITKDALRMGGNQTKPITQK